MTNSRASKIIGFWWCALGCLNAYPVLGQDLLAELVTVNGKQPCRDWHATLRNNPSERVIFTGYDEFGGKVKVFAGPTTWRFVVIAEAEESKLGCQFLQGDLWTGIGFLVR